MTSAPRSLPPPVNASRTWLKALHALSPPSVLRAKQLLQAARSPRTHHGGGGTACVPAQTPPPRMPARVMETIVQLIDFLEEHHRREEGLYRRDGSARESDELQRICQHAGEPLPDLATLRPHSITRAIKELLGRKYEPLVPYGVSQTLLERVAGREEAAMLDEVVDKFRLLGTATRDLLKVFLIHLHHISTSIPCRMDAKSLATHVGVLLLRPTEEPRSLAAKDLLKRRRRLARLMIDNANALPYDSDTERDSPGPSKAKRISMGLEKSEMPIVAESPRQHGVVHYVQAMWDAEKTTHTEASLRILLSQFGEIASLAVNDSGNRAIVAFSAAEGAQLAAMAALPDLRVRRRQQRGQRSSRVGSSTPSFASEPPTPSPSPSKPVAEEASDASPASEPPSQTADSLADMAEQKAVDTVHHLYGGDATTSLPPPMTKGDDLPEPSPTLLHKLERPPSMVLVQRAMATLQNRGNEMLLEDVESLPTSPEPAVAQAKANPQSLSAIHEERETLVKTVREDPPPPNQVAAVAPVDTERSGKTQRGRSLKELLTVTTTTTKTDLPEDSINPVSGAKGVFSSSTSSKIGLISDLKLMLSKKRTPKASRALTTSSVNVVPHQEMSGDVKPRSSLKTRSTQTPITILPLQDRVTDTSDLPALPDAASVDAVDASQEVANVQEQLTTAVLCLNEIQQELRKLDAAIGASRPSETERAIAHAHEQLIRRIDSALGAADHSDNHGQANDASAATREFVSFLETRSATQVKILEAEVRAGQELLRLHRAQHQKEILEVEGEITALRVTQSETEKMCAGLRGELRKCRTELACHVAKSASIQSDRRDVDEKLLVCENQLRAKEQELLQLQLAHAEMRDVAAKAQMRLEDQRGTTTNQQTHDLDDAPPKSSRTDNRQTPAPTLPQTTAFLSQHKKLHAPRAPFEPQQILRPGEYTNSVELATMKARLQDRIHAQIESTKASLREMQAFGKHHGTTVDGDAELDQLRQQLASAKADMDATMLESRLKLERLMDPARYAADESGDADDASSMAFDPTGLVETLLANALAGDWDADNSNDTQHQSTRRAETSRLRTPLRSHEDVYSSSSPPQPWEVLPPTTQSELYKRWIHGRAVVDERKPAATRSTARGQVDRSASRKEGDATLRQAQESMQRFQQTLASMAPLPLRASPRAAN